MHMPALRWPGAVRFWLLSRPCRTTTPSSWRVLQYQRCWEHWDSISTWRSGSVARSSTGTWKRPKLRRAEEWADFQQRQRMHEVQHDGLLVPEVDTLWDFVRRRAVSEFLAKGMGDSAQPPSLKSEVRKWFASVEKDLKDFYKSTGESSGDKELFVAIEHAFGDRLLHEVCIPNGVSEGACVLAAIAICREP